MARHRRSHERHSALVRDRRQGVRRHSGGAISLKGPCESHRLPRDGSARQRAVASGDLRDPAKLRDLAAAERAYPWGGRRQEDRSGDGGAGGALLPPEREGSRAEPGRTRTHHRAARLSAHRDRTAHPVDAGRPRLSPGHERVRCGLWPAYSWQPCPASRVGARGWHRGFRPGDVARGVGLGRVHQDPGRRAERRAGDAPRRSRRACFSVCLDGLARGERQRQSHEVRTAHGGWIAAGSARRRPTRARGRVCCRAPP